MQLDAKHIAMGRSVHHRYWLVGLVLITAFRPLILGLEGAEKNVGCSFRILDGNTILSAAKV